MSTRGGLTCFAIRGRPARAPSPVERRAMREERPPPPATRRDAMYRMRPPQPAGVNWNRAQPANHPRVRTPICECGRSVCH